MNADSIASRTLQMAGDHLKYVAVDKATDATIDKAKEMLQKENIHGKNIRVIDGNTLEVLTSEQKTVRVRLEGIDAPPLSEAFGRKSKETLIMWLENEDITVEVSAKDKYDRLIGVVFLDGININRSLVEKGLARVHEQSLKDKALIEIESKAKTSHLGIWS